MSKPVVVYRRERWNTPDGDFIDIYFVDGQRGKPMVFMFHGLEGSSDSHYSRALMAHAVVPTLVLNARNDPFLPYRHLPRIAAACVTTICLK